MLQHFRKMALYNRWANERLYAACAQLSEEEYHQQRTAFFKSIHGTLNHLLVADLIWRSRILRQPQDITSLDQLLHESFQHLRRARRTFDEELIEYFDEVTPADLERKITYTPVSSPSELTENTLSTILVHLFNHQTHHRGQAHGLLSQTSVAPPPLDYIIFARKN